MVAEPGEYRWSSYRIYGLGISSDLWTPRPEYSDLGGSPIEPQNNYRTLFAHQIEGDLLEEIRTKTNKGMAIGHDRFKEEIETLADRRVIPKKRGRPLGWRNQGI